MDFTLSIAQEALQLIKRGEFDRALALLDAATVAQGNAQEIERLRAAALAQTGALDAAVQAIERAMRSSNIESATRALAARIYEDTKRWQAAFEQYEWLTNAQPSQIAFVRGVWRVARAASHSHFEQRALRLTRELDIDVSIDSTLAWAVTSAILKQPLTEATVRDISTICDRTLARSNQDASARWLRVNRSVECEPERALDVVQSIAINAPTSADDVSVMLTIPQQLTHSEHVRQWRQRYQSGLQTLLRAPHVAAEWLHSTAFYLAYHGQDDTPLQRLRGDLLAKTVSPIATAINEISLNRPAAPNSKQRLPRIAFISKHIRDCTVGHYFQRLITELNPAHDKQFEVWVYVCNTPDTFTDAIAAHVDSLQVVPLAANSDNDRASLQNIASRIARDQIDVLIYPEIGMEPLIEKLAALRLAPTQCALWGHPVTTGLPTIDVFFSAASMEPESAERHYREQLRTLPGLGTSYPKPPAPAHASRVELGLPSDLPLVLCAQSSFKWSPDFMCAVAEIFSRQPKAKLVYFINREPASAYVFERALRSTFSERGIDFDQRAHRIAEMPRARFLSVLSVCDLALDTFGFSGGNTSLDALSVGLPVLTLPGEFMRGRQTMAMLQTVDAAELIAIDREDYITRAARLIEAIARDDADVKTLRSKITRNANQLFDDPAPVTALREHLLSLVKQ
jgi:CRISPR-associated protein Csy1